MLMNGSMNPIDLTVNQLKRAASIKEHIEALNKELRGILGASTKTRAALKKKGTMSAAVKKKIAATQRARWASLRRASPAMRSAKPAAKAKKKTFSRATRAKLSAKLKAYWAAKRAGKK
jgi:septal ring factor EnvC (AmiA/AmiB activator)